MRKLPTKTKWGETLYAGYQYSLNPNYPVICSESILWFLTDALPRMVVEGTISLEEAQEVETRMIWLHGWIWADKPKRLRHTEFNDAKVK